MDDSANVDLADTSPIGRPDRFHITVKQLWRTGETFADAESDANCHHGSPQWLPHPTHNLQRLKHLTLETNLSHPFLYPSDLPSTVGNTPLSHPHPFDYSCLSDESLMLQFSKVDGDIRFHHHPHPSIYVREIHGANRVGPAYLSFRSQIGSR